MKISPIRSNARLSTPNGTQPATVQASPRFAGDEWKAPAAKIGVIALFAAAIALTVGSFVKDTANKVNNALKNNTPAVIQKK